MKKHIVLALALVFSGFALAQDTYEPAPDVGFAVIENVPVYPGCSGDDNATLKKCMSDKISKFVVSKFNVKKASKGLEPGTHRIYVNFLIGRDGKITKINSRAPNATLEKEVTRIIKKLPKMKAGRQKGQAVGVLYTLPITFKIDKDKNKKG